MVPLRGIEPPTHALRMRCSTPELQRRTAAEPLLNVSDNKGNQFFLQACVFRLFFNELPRLLPRLAGHANLSGAAIL